MDLKGLEGRLTRIKDREIGLIGGSLKVNPLIQKANIIAYIEQKRWQIEININPNWRPEEDDLLFSYMDLDKNQASEKLREEVIFEISRDILYHEGRHWQKENGCPTDIINHDVILDNVHRALENSGKITKGRDSGEEGIVCGLTAYVANAFEDIIVNSANRFAHPDGYKGLPAFFYDQGKNSKFNDFFECFVKLNMQLWGIEEDEKLVKKFYSRNILSRRKIENVLQNIIQNLGIDNKNLEETVEILSNKDNWGKMAYSFARDISQLIQSGQDQAPLNPSDSDSKGKSKSAQGIGEKERRMKDPEEIRKIIKKRMEKGSRAGPSRPSYMKCFEFLDALYDHLSSQIPLKAETRQRNFDLPIVDYAYEEFDPETHSLDEINFRRMIASPESPFAEQLKKPINFQVPREHYPLQIPTKVGQRGYPDICLIFDTSGSMERGNGNKIDPEVGWNTGSKYHFALLGFYGIVKYLQAEGIAPYLKWNLINFGDLTLPSGWKNYGDLRELKKHALTPQFGGTVLDTRVLEKELVGSPSLVIMLSDGEISNWYGISDDVKRLFNRHYPSFIQIGASKTGVDMDSWGVPVYTVNKAEDLTSLMIDLTRKKVKEIYRLR